MCGKQQKLVKSIIALDARSGHTNLASDWMKDNLGERSQSPDCCGSDRCCRFKQQENYKDIFRGATAAFNARMTDSYLIDLWKYSEAELFLRCVVLDFFFLLHWNALGFCLAFLKMCLSRMAHTCILRGTFIHMHTVSNKMVEISLRWWWHRWLKYN